MRSPFLVTMVVARQRTSRMRPMIGASSIVDPVADLEVALELQREAGHDVAQRLLQREADTAVVSTDAVNTLVTSTSERVSTNAAVMR